MFKNPGSKGREMDLSPKKIIKKNNKKRGFFFLLTRVCGCSLPFAEVKLPKLQKRGKTIENRGDKKK